ncbi:MULTISPECIES: helix-turn-helix domain-containing protein [unclassified Streptomyces]|uniref:helix-turn-helix domain-containing protein n=1 Tax=unclassified Streptomyces TaxID=2593676 RepID=UPI0013712051|nr:helix-turn-helix domain-containing protein [Streptomyces sp. SID335]MYZ19091.1 helix-turn-helix domain-containing protein [Streptomyces sp. SID337]NDZ89130.1 helix-turn-helix domain-containing protein [Streptomyces sp. SID10115]NDZ99056.1 helix-turn-helix domain-containing protein [Streptomyces sp. SID10116]NEB44009.1 helix-turn-helix domain-containing protein [Streptomyces sp. SID339]
MSTRSGTAAVSPGAETSTDVESAFARWLTPLVTADGTDGCVMLRQFGYVRMLTCEARSLRLVRGLPAAGPRATVPGSDWDSDSGDAVVLVVPREGTVRVTQDRRGVSVAPGESALVDLRRPFSVELGHEYAHEHEHEHEGTARTLFLRLPLHALHVPSAPLPSLTARALRPSAGSAGSANGSAGSAGSSTLLPVLLRHLETSAPQLSAPVGERLGGLVTDLVAGLVEDLAEDTEGPPEDDRHPLLVTIHQYIDRHLGDPDLSAEQIAAAHLISVRYLHRLFEAEGVTVGRLIQRQRVERCAGELARRGRSSPSIAVVAARWGFRSPAHFSRAFKSVYGHPPQQWRRMAMAGAADVPGARV